MKKVFLLIISFCSLFGSLPVKCGEYGVNGFGCWGTSYNTKCSQDKDGYSYICEQLDFNNAKCNKYNDYEDICKVNVISSYKCEFSHYGYRCQKKIKELK